MDCLKKKTLIVFTALLLSFFSSFFLISVNASNVRSETFTSYFSTGASLGFQNGNEYVLITISNGTLNSSNSIAMLNNGGGYYRFVSNETVTLLITFNVSNCKIHGDRGNDYRIIQTGSSFPINVNDNVLIQWVVTADTWLPLMFIFGVLGLLTTFTGALYGVSEIKKGNYYNGLRMATLLICLGIAFVLAWLWG